MVVTGSRPKRSDFTGFIAAVESGGEVFGQGNRLFFEQMPDELSFRLVHGRILRGKSRRL